MRIEMLKSKIHRAIVTNKNIDYVGSITIDKEICEKANILEFEKVEIYNINNGKRFSTYVIFGKSGAIELNGAAARLGEIGDKIIIVSYAMFDAEEAKKHKPKIVILEERNKIDEEVNG